MFIKRTQAKSIKESADQFKVVGIIGPRQSGKTTLVRWLFKDYDYVNLENIDEREFAQKDPRAFLNQFQNGLIIDEFQHVPDLLSYIQTRVDEVKKNGMYILAGSQNFLMNQAISQSLAGRVSLHTLLPLSIDELAQAKLLPETEDALMYKGFYPSLYEAEVSIEKWYASYVNTYLERDVRQLSQVADLSLFRKFMQLCAGRIGQIVNLTSLANDCGISDKTARGWLSILEASYILYVLQPHHKNFSKRLVKSPKIYFYDTGLASYLLRIKPEQIGTHYLNGGLFETMIISDLFKSYYNRGVVPRIYFWRDRTGHEIDCILDEGVDLIPIEIKRGHTINQSFFKNLTFWNELSQTDPEKNYIVYGGDAKQSRSKGKVLGWRKTDDIVGALYD